MKVDNAGIGCNIRIETKLNINMKKIETFTLSETRFLSNFYPYKNKQGEKYSEKVRLFWID